MKQIPSRVLNEPSNIMGLISTDILAISGVFVISQRLLYYVGLEIFAILIAFVLAIGLSVVRMKYRRKIIRDSIIYFFSKYICSGVIYVR